MARSRLPAAATAKLRGRSALLRGAGPSSLSSASSSSLPTTNQKVQSPGNEGAMAERNRRESLVAERQHQGARLANKFIFGLVTKTSLAKKKKEAQSRGEGHAGTPSSGHRDTETALKQALMDGISEKMDVLSTKIRRMQLDARQQLVDVHSSSSSSRGGQEDANDPSASARRQQQQHDQYVHMLRMQKTTLANKRRQKEEKRKAGSSRIKALARTLERRSHRHQRSLEAAALAAAASAAAAGAGAHNAGGGSGTSPSKGAGSQAASSSGPQARKQYQRKQAAAAQYEFAKDSLRRRTLREGLKRQIGKVDFDRDDGSPPFELPTKELLQLVSMELNFRDERERAKICQHLDSRESRLLLSSTFWYLYLVLFDSRYPDIEVKLLAQIAEQYMRMLDLYGRGSDTISPKSAKAAASAAQQPSPYGATSPKRKKRSLVPYANEMFAIAHNMTRSHDRFFQFCPFVVGLSVCYALHFLFPTSRHEYHHGLTLMILEEVFLVMTGIQFTRASLERMLDCEDRKTGLVTQLAVQWQVKSEPAPVDDGELFLPPVSPNGTSLGNGGGFNAGVGVDGKQESSSSSSSNNNPFGDLPGRIARGREARSGAGAGTPASSSVVTGTPRSVAGGGGGGGSGMSPRNKSPMSSPTSALGKSERDRKLVRQPREDFAAMAVSPAGRVYLRKVQSSPDVLAHGTGDGGGGGGGGGLVHSSGPKVLRRTVQDSRCRFGGVEALERHDLSSVYDEQARQSQEVYKTYRDEETEFKNRDEREKQRCRAVLKQLDGLKGLVLRRGTKFLRSFSLDMVTGGIKSADDDDDHSHGSGHHNNHHHHHHHHDYMPTAECPDHAIHRLKHGVPQRLERLLHVGNAIGGALKS